MKANQDSTFEPKQPAPLQSDGRGTGVAGSHPQPRRGHMRGYYLKRVAIVVSVLALIFAGMFAYRVSTLGSTILEGDEQPNLVNQIKQLVVEDPNPEPLQGEEDDRINVLLLGLGGEGHSGAYLTDTIIIASIRPSDNAVALLSIPRDLYVQVPGYWSTKINAAYALEYDQTGSDETASALLSEVVENVTGLPIHYYLRVDFAGFTEAIDALGGVEIDVQNSFVDYQYPTPSYGYETLRFDEGVQTMDGELALKYARSRKAAGPEGGDFARAQRQQQVIEAARDQALSAGTLLNPIKIAGLLDALGGHVATNMQLWEIERFADFAEGYDSEQSSNYVLEAYDGTNPQTGLLTFGNIPGAGSIVVPRAGTFAYDDIRSFAADVLDLQQLVAEAATVEVYNGTTNPGLAGEVAEQVEAAGFEVVAIDNADVQGYERTVLYDRTAGENESRKPFSLRVLVDLFSPNTTTIPPATPEQDETGDFVIILGDDFVSL